MKHSSAAKKKARVSASHATAQFPVPRTLEVSASRAPPPEDLYCSDDTADLVGGCRVDAAVDSDSGGGKARAKKTNIPEEGYSSDDTAELEKKCRELFGVPDTPTKNPEDSDSGAGDGKPFEGSVSDGGGKPPFSKTKNPPDNSEPDDDESNSSDPQPTKTRNWIASPIKEAREEDDSDCGDHSGSGDGKPFADSDSDSAGGGKPPAKNNKSKPIDDGEPRDDSDSGGGGKPAAKNTTNKPFDNGEHWYESDWDDSDSGGGGKPPAKNTKNKPVHDGEHSDEIPDESDSISDQRPVYLPTDAEFDVIEKRVEAEKAKRIAPRKKTGDAFKTPAYRRGQERPSINRLFGPSDDESDPVKLEFDRVIRAKQKSYTGRARSAVERINKKLKPDTEVIEIGSSDSFDSSEDTVPTRPRPKNLFFLNKSPFTKSIGKLEDAEESEGNPKHVKMAAARRTKTPPIFKISFTKPLGTPKEGEGDSSSSDTAESEGNPKPVKRAAVGKALESSGSETDLAECVKESVIGRPRKSVNHRQMPPVNHRLNESINDRQNHSVNDRQMELVNHRPSIPVAGRLPVADSTQVETPTQPASQVGTTPLGDIEIIEVVDSPTSLPAEVDYTVTEYPTWWEERHDMNDEDLAKANWLTYNLVKEVQSLFPTEADKDKQSGVRDVQKLAENLKLLFPPKRIFASFKQIHQMLTMFALPWGFVHAYSSGSFICSYGKGTAKKCRRPEDRLVAEELQREKESLKEEVDCPFVICATKVNHTRKHRKNHTAGIRFLMKINDSSKYEHTCSPSPTAQRLSMVKSGKSAPNFEQLKELIELLRINPNLDSRTIRSICQEKVYRWRNLDSNYIKNIRKWALRFNLNPDPSVKPTQADLEDLEKNINCKETPPAWMEYSEVADDNLLGSNFFNMLQDIMANSSDTWEVIQLLEQTKLENPGFDYRIRKNDKGAPNGLCFMTNKQRIDLVRYGSRFMCLDMQLKQFNTWGWPYCAPTGRDCEMKIVTFVEGIVPSERHEGYEWVMFMMVEMEPRFELSSIKIVFGDEFITDNLLRRLGIGTTCLGRCDHYHMVQKVWPSQFGGAFGSISEHLTGILVCTRESQFLAHVKAARETPSIAGNLELMAKLDDIVRQQSRYSGHVLAKTEGNCKIGGSQSSESNNASVSSHLGIHSGGWALVFQVKELLQRQQHFAASQSEYLAKLDVRIRSFRSKLARGEAVEDHEAKSKLSNEGYRKYFQNRRAAQFMETEDNIDGTVSVINTHSRNTQVIIELEGRCPCSYRVAYLIQCSHEILIHGFKISMWDETWLNDIHHRALYPTRGSPNGRPSRPITNNSTTLPPVEVVGRSTIDHEQDLPEQAELAPGVGITFNSVMDDAKDLVRTVVNKPNHLSQISTVLTRLTTTVRLAGTRYMNRVVTSVCATLDAQVREIEMDPLSQQTGTSVSATQTLGRGRPRIQSALERQRGSSKRKSPQWNAAVTPSARTSGDRAHLPPPNQARRHSCSFCGGEGHKIGSKCAKYSGYGVYPLKKKDAKGRRQLLQALQVADRFITSPSPPTANQTLRSGNHKGMKGIILHRRLYVDASLDNKDSMNNFCFEATFLGSTGDQVHGYKKRIFSMLAITTILTTSSLFVYNLILDGGEVRDGSRGGCPIDAPAMDNNHELELPEVTVQEFVELNVQTDGVQEYGDL